MTDAERALWHRLRNGRLDGLKFRRQHPFPPYIVDIYCAEAKLIIELDGSQHGAGVDATRTAALERQGLQVLRFWDNQVFENLDGVLQTIMNTARERTLTRRCAQKKKRRSAPSPGGRGEKQKEAQT